MEELVEELHSRFGAIPRSNSPRPLTKEAFITATWLCSYLHSQVTQEQVLDLLQVLWKTQIDTTSNAWEMPKEIPPSVQQILQQFSDLLEHFPAPEYQPNADDLQKIQRAQEQASKLQSLDDISDASDNFAEETSEAEAESETPPPKNKFQLLAEFSDEDDDDAYAGHVQVTQDDYAKWWTAVDVAHADDISLDDDAEDLLEDGLDYETLGEELESSLLKVARSNRQAKAEQEATGRTTPDDSDEDAEADSDWYDGEDLLQTSDDVDAALIDVLGSGLMKRTSPQSSRLRATERASDRLLLHDDEITLDNFDKLSDELRQQEAETDDEVEYEYVDEDGNPVEGPGSDDDEVEYEYVEVEEGAETSTAHDDHPAESDEVDDVEDDDDDDDDDFAELSSLVRRTPKEFDWDNFLDSED